MKHRSITDWLMWLRYHSIPLRYTTTGTRPCPYCEDHR